MSVAVPRKLYQTLAIAVALAFVYFTVLLKLGGDWWNDENYSHGLLIPFVIGYSFSSDHSPGRLCSELTSRSCYRCHVR